VTASQLDPGGVRIALSGSIAALQAGDPDDPPVLMLPGYTGSKEDFAPLLGPLADAGLFVTAVDLPGQYETPGPDDPAAYTPAELARTVIAVATELGPSVHLLGHSFGGLVARAAVIHQPERFASLVLLCSGPAALGGLRRQRIEQLEPVLAHAGVAAVYAAMQAAVLTEPGYVQPDPELAAFFERRFLAGPVAGLQGMGDALRTEPDRVAELAAAGVPTLVACGEHDDAWPPDVQADMAARLGCEFRMIPAAAHSPAVENAAATAQLLRSFWLPQA
jgi:pimeloyl-ACP methyl ester carboxylesterase